MTKDDISLGVEMGRLEIEPAKINKTLNFENPFIDPTLREKRNIFSRTCIREFKCSCSILKKSKHLAMSKKKRNKILKEPVLKLLRSDDQDDSLREESQKPLSKKCSLSSNEISDSLNLCALVDNCNQLRISSGSNEHNSLDTELNNDNQWWKTNVSHVRQSRDVVSPKNQAGSCSQEALNPPCDITIDELASYFETLVHIPKKMSTMAEMMYI